MKEDTDFGHDMTKQKQKRGHEKLIMHAQKNEAAANVSLAATRSFAAQRHVVDNCLNRKWRTTSSIANSTGTSVLNESTPYVYCLILRAAFPSFVSLPPWCIT